VAVRHSLSIYQRRYFAPVEKDAARGELIISDPVHVSEQGLIELDDLDWRCLQALTTPCDQSLAATARALAVPVQTLHRRVTRLKQLGVIKGFMCSFNFRALGIQRFKILIETTAFEPALEARMQQIARNNPYVTNFAVCFGQWDYELSLETWDDKAVSDLLGVLGTALGGMVREVRVLPIVSYYKFSFQVNKDR
jgi:DNA-binding Lrp family transcriptional regulator